MIPKRNWLECLAISAFFLLLSVAGAVWDFASRLLFSGIDGIMLLAVCLVTGGIFALMIVVDLQRGGILPTFGRKKTPAPVGAAKTAPAAAPLATPAKTAPPQPTVQTK
ncbi:MAG TPA: hypothetical protein VEJ67_15435 [Candidatus Cybelea sp.]|nr:hypothetical protein [Candidatus Cybelea sp.]